MIAKQQITSLISKYYLGTNETVKWVINNNNLEINFESPSKDVRGSVICSDFQLENTTLGIYETKKLSALLSMCQGELLLELEKVNTISTKLHISDLNFNVAYSLCDTYSIPKIGTINLPNEYEIEINLSSEDISNLIRAKSALSEVDNMFFQTALDLDGGSVCEVVFSDGYTHSNKVIYQLQGKITSNNIKIPFNSSMFKTILQANKDMEVGTLRLNSGGLLHLKFHTDTVTSEYYMVRRAEAEF
jgi:hypothetical protein|tara:strand:- start:28 stop:765 length:738 start_codon:yes stop_codon:yes gene_type:complete